MFQFFKYPSFVVVSWVDFGCCLMRRMGVTLYFRTMKIDVTMSREHHNVIGFGFVVPNEKVQKSLFFNLCLSVR